MPLLKGAGGIKMKMLQIIFGRGGQGAQPPGPLSKTLSPNPLYYIKKIEVLILDFPKT